MKLSEYASEADKTRVEICKLLKTLNSQFEDIATTISEIEKTLYNEEYEDD